MSATDETLLLLAIIDKLVDENERLHKELEAKQPIAFEPWKPYATWTDSTGRYRIPTPVTSGSTTWPTGPSHNTKLTCKGAGL